MLGKSVAVLLISSCALGLELELGEEVDASVFPAYAALVVHRLDVSAPELAGADEITLPGEGGETLLLKGEPQVDGHFVSLEFEGDGTDSEAEITVDLATMAVSGFVQDLQGTDFLIVSEEDPDGRVEYFWIEVDPASHVKDTGSGSDGGNRSHDLDDAVDESVAAAKFGRLDRSTGVMSRFLTSAEYWRALQRARDEPNTLALVSVKVYYSSAIATTAIHGHINNIIRITNDDFLRSGINLRVFLHCTEEYTRAESNSNLQLLEDFAAFKNNDVSRLLDSSDLAMLLVQGSSSVSGIAYTNTYRWPFGMAKLSNALSFHTFAHEVAHIFGATHDRAALGSRSPPHPYGVGYIMTGTGKSTVMAYPQGTRRIGYFSGSSLRDNEGDRTGNADADNVRVANERRFVYQAIGDESTCTTSPPPTRDPDCSNVRPDSHCDYWRRQGFCSNSSQYYSFMFTNCAEACDTCV